MFIVIELQKNGNELSNIVTTFTDKNQAESKFYQVMSAAAVSSVDKHSVCLLTEDGECLMAGTYMHE